MARRPAAAAGVPPLPHDRELFFKLVRVVNLTGQPFVETLARRHRLSLNEWRTMIVLASEPGVAAHEIVEITGLDKMSVSRAVAALARQGRIVKRDDPQDARRARLELSAAGRRLYEQIGVFGRAREQQLFGGLDAAERVQLEALVDRLLAAIQAHTPQPRAPRRRRTAAAAGLTGYGQLVTIDTKPAKSIRRIRKPTP